MSQLRTDRRAGFTLIELLIVVAILGLLASMLIPNLLDAMQKAKQKRTVADIHLVGTAMMAWLTDQAHGAAAGATFELGSYSSIPPATLEDILSPEYIQEIPKLDGWKYPYEYYLDTGDAQGPEVMAVRSGGRNATMQGTTYTPGGFAPTDYDQDIVWADGFFVRWPEGGAGGGTT